MPQELLCTGDENILISHKRVEGKAWGRRGKPQERAESRRERGGGARSGRGEGCAQRLQRKGSRRNSRKGGGLILKLGGGSI